MFNVRSRFIQNFGEIQFQKQAQQLCLGRAPARHDVACLRAARRRPSPADPRRPCPAHLPDDPSARGHALPEVHTSRRSLCPRTPRTAPATPPYSRRARGGPPVRPRRRPYARRSSRRSTADALPSSPAVTRAHLYLRPPCSPLLKDRYGEPERGGVNGSR
jgi:hypothetical protein